MFKKNNFVKICDAEDFKEVNPVTIWKPSHRRFLAEFLSQFVLRQDLYFFIFNYYVLVTVYLQDKPKPKHKVDVNFNKYNC